jgi:3-oxoadipate enol-lactonase
MPSAKINGIDLYYEVHGEGPALAFAHGGGGNHAIWWQQVPYFSQWYKVITIDQRGFGLSRDVPEGPGRDAFVEDLRGLLDHLEIEQTALVAQSLGGWTCLGFAASYPERVWALVLANTVGAINDPALQQRLKDIHAAKGGRRTVANAYSKGYLKNKPELANLFHMISSFNYSIEAPAGPIASLVGTDAPTPEDLKGLKVPVLFIAGGEEDRSTPLDVMQMAHKIIPGSSLVQVPEAGHSVYYEQPEIFNYLVHNFLKKSATNNRS